MRLVVDLQAAQSHGSRIRGIGRYSLALAEAFARNAGGHEVWVALNHQIPEVVEAIKERLVPWMPEERVVVWESLHGTSAIDAANLPARRVAERLREEFLASLSPDVVHVSSLFEGMTDAVVTSVPRKNPRGVLHTVSLYDLIPYVRRDVYLQDPRASAWYLEKVNSLLRADLLLGISEHTCAEAIEHLSIDPRRVVNISAGLGDEFWVMASDDRARAAERLCSRFGLGDRFVVYTGGFDARKNIDGLIRAFSQLPGHVRSGVQLVLVGHGPADVVNHLLLLARECGLAARDVVYTDYVDDEDLRAIYNLCALHVFPSFHEGFGLPVLEAMACGAPVIGSNTTSLPEVIGLPEAMFDPHSLHDIASHIERALVDDAFRARLRAHATTQVSKFDWDVSAQRAFAAMEHLHGARGGQGHSVAPPPRGTLSSLARELCEAIPDEASFTALRNSTADAMALNVRPARPQLLVDVTVLSALDIGTGIQRVVRNIAQNLLAHGHEQFDVRLVRFEHGTGYLYADAFVARLRGTAAGTPDVPIDAYPGDVLLGLDLIAHVVPPERAHFERLRRRGVKVWFVVYDMLPVLFPQYFRDEVRAPFVPWYDAIGEVASGLACISASVSHEVADWFDQVQPHRASPLPLAHFHLGADLDSGHEILPRQASAHGAGKSFLMVGTVEPRKGHRLVLDAFEHLWNEGENVRLTVIGKPGWLVDDLIERLRTFAADGDRLVWHEDANDAILSACYAQADALVMASEGEGFGLPLIEAAQHGLPLIARDLPVFREIAGEAAFYFSDRETPEGLARALQAWSRAHDAGRHPRPDDMHWLTWRESTRQLLDAIGNPSAFAAWRPGARFVVSALHPGVLSDNATRAGDALVPQGDAGRVAYGPLLHLPKGDYAVEVVLQPQDEASRAIVELGPAKGAPLNRLEAGAGMPEQDGRLVLRCVMHLPRAIEDLEIRILVPEGDRTGFVRCTITPVRASRGEQDSRSRRIEDLPHA